MRTVTVYRFRKFVSETQEYFISTRMATREWIESMKTLELISDSGVEISIKQLAPGEAWTDKNFVYESNSDRLMKEMSEELTKKGIFPVGQNKPT